MSKADLLIEIGTEELPPKALSGLSAAFTQGIVSGLAEQRLEHGEVESFASPRRLAVLVRGVTLQAESRDIEVLGPPVDRAKDDDGNWTPAAEGFARKQGVAVEALETADTDKGARLCFRSQQQGARCEDSLEAIIDNSLKALPIPKRMRWGAGRTEFVRPAHWAVVLLGEEPIKCNVLGLASGSTSRGHRFHAPGEVQISSAENYAAILKEAHVLASFEERREIISQQVTDQADIIQAQVMLDDDLLDEVTALVEWPVALMGRFEERFLQVPSEALVYSMKEHQKYFPVVNSAGELLPHFITVSNIESKDPAQVIDGNERVIRPRLSDADFFFSTDKKTPLVDRVEVLQSIVFQQKLGTLFDKTQRLVGLSAYLAAGTGADQSLAERAALLAKTDLLTEMVGEFADMQGTAGRYYALHDGEEAAVAAALEQQYWPRYSGAELPQESVATTLALADRLDTLVGIFGIGQQPTGSKDPFALRRASLGVLRIMVEGELQLDLRECLTAAAEQFADGTLAEDTVEQVLVYMIERFRAWYEDEQIAVEVFKAVSARKLTVPYDIHRRVLAVDGFSRLPQAQALAAANKRVANILADVAPESLSGEVSDRLLTEAAEQQLAAAIAGKRDTVNALYQDNDYSVLLTSLSELREVVDQFFDDVMVNVDDDEVRLNRQRLLAQLRELFLLVADISQLVPLKS